MVVDDDPGIRFTLRKLLTAAGHEVLLAKNGLEATQLLRAEGGDLLILDVFMPEQDGVETLIQLRAMGHNLPVIAISGGGSNQIDLLLDAKLLGAYYTLQKPFTLAEMLALVDSALEGSDNSNP